MSLVAEIHAYLYQHFSFKVVGAWQNRRLATLPTTFNGDGFMTTHNADFVLQRRFEAAFEAACRVEPWNAEIAWRAHVCCWAAEKAMALVGDFVECGVREGIFSRTVMGYVNFEKSLKQFWLIDPEIGLKAGNYPSNVECIREAIPLALARVQTRKVAYLSIDMNHAEPEKAALEFFYPRMVPGGVILLDDYGWRSHEAQKQMADAFFAGKEPILSLPTGQGLVIKDARAPDLCECGMPQGCEHWPL